MKICDEFGRHGPSAFSELRLIYGEDSLEDERSLKSYNIRNSSTLLCTYYCYGGGTAPSNETE